jgi:GntR family transcriptional regulator, transcriptional repressor for pyruvate dehydrogenase complex
MSAPIERASVPDLVFRGLVEDVIAGRYAPGERLPTQRQLAADLDVNLASVREAVKRLEQLRLVEVRHGDAMRVRDWRREGGLDVLAHAVLAAGALDVELLREVFEARRLLLVEAARLAAQRRDPAAAEALRTIAAQLAAAQDDVAAQGLDFAFWATLVESAHNVVLLLVTNSIRDVYFRHAELFRVMVADRDELVPAFARVAEAVAAGDADGAATAVAGLAAAQEARLLERLA